MTTISASSGLPRIELRSSNIELLKWAGLLLMTVDHVNKYLFNGTSDAAFAAGRLAMPIFCFVLAYNLARVNEFEEGAYGRVAVRLAVTGLLASLPFLMLGGLWWNVYPLNAIFTLLVLTGVTRMLTRGQHTVALVAFVVGGAFVEFWWPAVLFGVAVWLYVRSPSWGALLLAAGACASLYLVNGNFWAFAALPLIALVGQLRVRLPRLRWWFYAFYPVHLAVLWLVRIPMSRAGYLFF